MAISPFTLPNGVTIYVETDDTQLNIPLIENTPVTRSGRSADLPPGSEQITSLSDAIIGGKLLQETIAGTAQSVLDSFKDMQPDEWSVEINIALKGKATIIPVLVSGSGEGSFKVTAKWKKSEA